MRSSETFPSSARFPSFLHIPTEQLWRRGPSSAVGAPVSMRAASSFDGKCQGGPGGGRDSHPRSGNGVGTRRTRSFRTLSIFAHRLERQPREGAGGPGEARSRDLGRERQLATSSDNRRPRATFKEARWPTLRRFDVRARSQREAVSLYTNPHMNMIRYMYISLYMSRRTNTHMENIFNWCTCVFTCPQVSNSEIHLPSNTCATGSTNVKTSVAIERSTLDRE